MGLLIFLLWVMIYIVILCIAYTVYTIHSHKTYFKKRNIPYMGAGVTRFLKIILGKTTTLQAEVEIYQHAVSYKSPIVGFTNMFNLSKGIYICDMETMKNVYVKDFDHFINRPRLTTASKKDYLSRMLFALDNDQWKISRTKTTQIFSTGKIKRMFKHFQKSSEGMTTYIKNHIGSEKSKDDLDFSQLLSKYIMDVIAATVFAFDSKAWEVPIGQKSKFEEMGNRYQFKFSPLKLIQFVVSNFPKLYDFLGFKLMDTEAEKYFADMIKQIIKHRRQTGERREDFLQYILDMQAGILKEDENPEENMSQEKLNSTGNESSEHVLDDEHLIAFLLTFFLARFDTTASALNFALYSITTEQKVQEKLYEEVSSKINENGGKLTYESLMEMTYLDNVISESLRMYSPNTQTTRVCTKDYIVPRTNCIIEKGSLILLPLYPNQYDDRYYPNPDKFIPERFTIKNKLTRSQFTWSPFGHGLRGCIAMRFALIKVKAVIAHLVYSFHFSPSPKTLIPVEFSEEAALKPKGGLWIKVALRK